MADCVCTVFSFATAMEDSEGVLYELEASGRPDRAMESG